MRPIDAGYCKFESLVDGTLTLENFALMNDALDVRAANEEIMRQQAERNT